MFEAGQYSNGNLLFSLDVEAVPGDSDTRLKRVTVLRVSENEWLPVATYFESPTSPAEISNSIRLTTATKRLPLILEILIPFVLSFLRFLSTITESRYQRSTARYLINKRHSEPLPLPPPAKPPPPSLSFYSHDRQPYHHRSASILTAFPCPYPSSHHMHD